jgi:hypothetical protein
LAEPLIQGIRDRFQQASRSLPAGFAIALLNFLITLKVLPGFDSRPFKTRKRAGMP